jgi:hypothetical protein
MTTPHLCPNLTHLLLLSRTNIESSTPNKLPMNGHSNELSPNYTIPTNKLLDVDIESKPGLVLQHGPLFFFSICLFLLSIELTHSISIPTSLTSMFPFLSMSYKSLFSISERLPYKYSTPCISNSSLNLVRSVVSRTFNLIDSFSVLHLCCLSLLSCLGSVSSVCSLAAVAACTWSTALRACCLSSVYL